MIQYAYVALGGLSGEAKLDLVASWLTH
jgi:hypothetical protein